MAQRFLSTVLTIALAAPTIVSAQQVSTRTDLNFLLPVQTIESFSGFAGIGPTFAAILQSGGFDVTSLDNAAALDGFGTGTVNSALRFEGSQLQINAPGFFGVASNSLSVNHSEMEIFFLTAVNAVGLDLASFAGRGVAFSVSAFAPGNVLLGSVLFNGTEAPSSEFFGWQNAGGIDHIEVERPLTLNNFTAAVDNVTFGNTLTASPEPATLTLLATGLVVVGAAAQRRRKA